ncbi:MAG: hypothetical protein UU48_C0009G0004 [Candidatus Uhrbacteria bacterium GW2011_GWF2_41_16]|uniref:Uncharacterized protein n=2 Tax=Candidatus Uhriibacteriota TaxID=1752732 RepID=A0A0G0YBP7_9BACT|nr:MAG: hypothetical protein UU35_C0011G0002 [Candidatus Uhrbacteria bacterium GW2011_GWC2_41_11]KKR97732.1 MAG: hypothetical protein UU48_C0009G0004 [Candidatus Uhrbacteria bacterium GW2011_GWF2_41_16]
MSHSSLENPFRPHEQRKGNSTHLMNIHLSPAEVQALTEVLGEDEPSKPESQQDLLL